MADNEQPEFDVEIRINSDTSGADPAKRALRETGEAAEEAGTRAGSGFGKIITGSRAGSAAIRGLNNVMRGGAAAAGGLAQILNDLFLVIRSGAASAGPIALLALGIGVLIGVMRGLASHSREAHKGMSEAGEAATKLKEHLSEIDKESGKELKTILEDVKALTQAYHETSDAIDQNYERVKKFAAAQHQLTQQTINEGELSELGATNDPGRRAEITARYGGVRAASEANYKQQQQENEFLRAQVRAVNARGTIDAIKQQRSKLGAALVPLGSAAAAAQQEFNESVIHLPRAELLTEYDMQKMREKRNASTEAQRRLDDAKHNINEFELHAEPDMRAAEKDIRGAQEARQIKPLLDKINAKTQEDDIRKKVYDNDRVYGVEREKIQAELSSIHETQTSGFANSFSDPNYAKRSERESELRKKLDDLQNEMSYRDGAIISAFQEAARQAKKTAGKVEKESRQLENQISYGTGI